MRYQGLLPDGIPYRALDSACGNGPTAIAWATSVCCREGQLGGRWPSGRAYNVASARYSEAINQAIQAIQAISMSPVDAS